MEEFPFRLRVLMNLTTALTEITVANGYKYDLTDSVFRGRLLFGEDDPLPMASIIEPALPEEFYGSMPDGANFSPDMWNLVIQGWVEDDHKNPTDPAHILLADVKQRLILERKKTAGLNRNALGMGKRLTGIEIGPGVVRPPDQQSDRAYFWLTLKLGIVENLEEPYA
jgi:hypothetical protein